MTFEKLNNNNFLLFAAKSYKNHQCMTVDEFKEDLNRFKYLKRLFNKYHTTKELNERLILNHLVVIYNVFGIKEANQMIFFKMNEEYHSALKTFLVYLNYLPEDVAVDVKLDQDIIEILRKI